MVWFIFANPVSVIEKRILTGRDSKFIWTSNKSIWNELKQNWLDLFEQRQCVLEIPVNCANSSKLEFIRFGVFSVAWIQVKNRLTFQPNYGVHMVRTAGSELIWSQFQVYLFIYLVKQKENLFMANGGLDTTVQITLHHCFKIKFVTTRNIDLRIIIDRLKVIPRYHLIVQLI